MGYKRCHRPGQGTRTTSTKRPGGAGRLHRAAGTSGPARLQGLRMGHRKLPCVPEAALDLVQQHRHPDTFNRTGLLLLGGSQTTCSTPTRAYIHRPVASSNRFHCAHSSAMAAVPAIYEKNLSRILGRYLQRAQNLLVEHGMADCITLWRIAFRELMIGFYEWDISVQTRDWLNNSEESRLT